MLSSKPTLTDIKEAHSRISEFIFRTPVLASEGINDMAGCSLFFKCENFQKIGAFKMRGASNAIFSYSPEERRKGFACHSSGNHGQAVALASKLAGSTARVVMPGDGSKVKMKAVQGYGAEVILCLDGQSREEVCQEVVEATGAILIHPFDDYNIIAGQATASKELLEEINDLDAIIAPVGGGGLSAGTALCAHYVNPTIEMYLGEPEAVDDTYQSFKAGRIIPNTSTNTIADGLKTTIGIKNFEILKEHVADVLLVSEQEIVDAMKLIWERMKIIAEPSAAVPLASILKNKDRFSGKKVGVILTGGNVDLANLPF